MNRRMGPSRRAWRWSAPAKRHKNKPDLLALFLLQFLSRRGEEQRAGESERRLSSGPFLARRRGCLREVLDVNAREYAGRLTVGVRF